jgi:hypothetical protein
VREEVVSRDPSETTAREHLWVALQSVVDEGPLRKRLPLAINPLLRVANASGTSEAIKVEPWL